MIAAILTLSEGRPGIQEFWEDVRDGVEGWPLILPEAIALLSESKAGKSAIRRAELALYIAFAYCAHESPKNAFPELLLDKREAYEPYRAVALQGSFIGPTRYRMPRAVKHCPIRVQTATGRSTVVRIPREIYSVVALLLGPKEARELTKAAASTYQDGKEQYSLPTVVKEELKAFVRDNAKVARIFGVTNLDPFFAPPPPVKESEERTRKKRAPAKAGYITLSVKDKSGYTSISIHPQLFGKVVALLGCSEAVRAALQKAFDRCRTLERGERSRSTRELFLESLCLHPKVEHIRLP